VTDVFADQIKETTASVRPSAFKADGRTEVNLSPKSLQEFLEGTCEVEWLVEGLLPRRGILLKTGPGGIGKSWGTHDLTIALCTGRDWLGLGTKKARILVIDEENDAALLRYRYERLLRAENVVAHQLQNLFLLCQTGLRLDNPTDIGALNQCLYELNPDVVIIDSLIRFHDGDENDAGHMAKVFGQLKRLMNANDCAFVVTHHAGKMNGRSSRGSTDIVAAVDSHIAMSPTRGGPIRVEQFKARWGHPIATVFAEIADLENDSTVFRAVEVNDGASDGSDATSFLVTSLEDGEWMSRQDLLIEATNFDVSRDALDLAIDTLGAEASYETKTIARRKCIRRTPSESSSADADIEERGFV